MTIDREAQYACQEFRSETHLGSRTATVPRFIVHALGRDFRVTDEMAQIFLRQVERVLDRDPSALCVLRHEHGVELLLVTDDNSFSIRDDKDGIRLEKDRTGAEKDATRLEKDRSRAEKDATRLEKERSRLQKDGGRPLRAPAQRMGA
ncbi:MAG TPA: hypothetical protein VIG28_05690 [Leifsonia sp.]